MLMKKIFASEWFKWLVFLAITALLLNFVSPGLVDSPYNEF
jgi:hypothetical protein